MLQFWPSVYQVSIPLQCFLFSKYSIKTTPWSFQKSLSWTTHICLLKLYWFGVRVKSSDLSNLILYSLIAFQQKILKDGFVLDISITSNHAFKRLPTNNLTVAKREWIPLEASFKLIWIFLGSVQDVVSWTRWFVWYLLISYWWIYDEYLLISRYSIAFIAHHALARMRWK